MRGSPLARALLTVVALLALLFPLQRLTSHQVAAGVAASGRGFHHQKEDSFRAHLPQRSLSGVANQLP